MGEQPESMSCWRMALSELGGGSNVLLGNGHWAMVAEPQLYPPVVKEEPAEETSAEEASTSEPCDYDVQIRNVVTAFNMRCHVPLRELALAATHVYYERSKGVLVKQMRSPKGHIKIWSSGKVAITGCQSEDEARRCARKVARLVQRRVKVTPRVRFTEYRVSNILATTKLPFAIRIDQVHVAYPEQTQYEPELMVGLLWRQKEPKAVLRIHTTGSVTVTGATSAADVNRMIAIIYPILERFSCPAEALPDGMSRRRRKRQSSGSPPPKQECLDSEFEDAEEGEGEENSEEGEGFL